MNEMIHIICCVLYILTAALQVFVILVSSKNWDTSKCLVIRLTMLLTGAETIFSSVWMITLSHLEKIMWIDYIIVGMFVISLLIAMILLKNIKKVETEELIS